jgi:cell fate regulator YaaT (PSP1 superfamily)
MTTSLRRFDLDGEPFQSRELVNCVPVELDTTFIKHDHDARELHLRPGDRVIVETERGPFIGTVRGHVHRRLVEEGKLPRVLRRASDHDESQYERNLQSEKGAYKFAIERIRARNLPMKLIRAQWMHDGSKIVFYFSADGRIDFRDLVKDLAHKFRTRIEMYQIGVRDGAQMIGGIGPCGRELCCSTFLENFAPVSIRMAKDQGLTLNPAKVSGMCGRLMCCLVYEQQLYRSMKRRVLRSGTRVRTRQGQGKVIDSDVLNDRVSVETDDGNRATFERSDVIVIRNEDDGYVDAPVEPNYVWDEELAPRKPKKSKRRRRRSKKSKSD